MILYVNKKPDPHTLAAVFVAVQPLSPELQPKEAEVMSQDALVEWIAEEVASGWTPAPVPTLNPVPVEVTPRQFKLALLQSGVSPSVITNAVATNEASLIEWEYATTFRRDHALLNSMASSFGFSPTDLDNLFRFASTL